MKTREPEIRSGRIQKRFQDRVQLSSEATCATSKECWMPSAKKPAKLAWLEGRELYTSDKNRVLFKRGTTYVDAITGTMYRDGRCLSSDTLELGNVKRDQKGAAEILMAIKGGGNENKNDAGRVA